MDLKKKEFGRAPGNKECIGLLKKWLWEAKKGKVAHIAIAVAIEPESFYTEALGSIYYQPMMVQLLDDLKNRVAGKVVGRKAYFDPKVGADHVTFALQDNNVNFDFLPWLISAEMYRVRNNAPAPLRVGFYSADQSLLEIPELQKQMMRNVIGPLVQAIGGVVAPVKWGKSDFSINYNEVVGHCLAGEKVPKFKATPLAKGAMDALLDGFPAPVTITLRESEHYENRNSNLEAWTKFASDLVKKGEHVIFVRDTARAEEELPGFTTLPVASENLMMRVALYERAKANLFVSNGPATIAYHLDPPFLIFTEIDPDNDYQPARPEWWARYHGIKVGTQYPWFHAQQKIVWQQDTYENISAAWEELNLSSAALEAAE